MALPFSMTELVLSHIHDEPRDWPNGRIRSRTAAGPVLLLLVIGFPAQAQIQASLPPLLRHVRQSVHLVLFHTATKRESAVTSQQNRERAQRRDISKLPAFLEETQRQIPPKLRN